MLLVKCKCGCFFTINTEALDDRPIQCQNCKERIQLTEKSEVSKFGTKSGITISAIPDNAKITVTFDT